MMDLGNPEEVAEQERQLAIEQEARDAELRGLLKQKAMRRFLWTLLSECGIYTLPFCGDQVNETHVKMGRQSIGHKIIEMVDNAEPHSYMGMYTEFRRDEEEDD